MSLSTIDGDLYVTGSMVANTMNIPSNTVGDGQVQAAANIAATKLEHRHNQSVPLCNHATSAAVVRLGAHRVYGATGTLTKFGVTASVAAGASSSITVDLKKNGSSILSSTITLDNTTAVNILKEPAGYTSTALVAGDVLDIEITAVSGANLPKGVVGHLVITEKA